MYRDEKNLFCEFFVQFSFSDLNTHCVVSKSLHKEGLYHRAHHKFRGFQISCQKSKYASNERQFLFSFWLFTRFRNLMDLFACFREDQFFYFWLLQLTHAVLVKEMKHCKHHEDLEVNENVKAKAKDFVKKYMGRYGAVYKRADTSSSSPWPNSERDMHMGFTDNWSTDYRGVSGEHFNVDWCQTRFSDKFCISINATDTRWPMRSWMLRCHMLMRQVPLANSFSGWKVQIEKLTRGSAHENATCSVCPF